MRRHLIDNHLNFKRMFAEAIRDSVVDNCDRSLIQPGYFRIRWGGRKCMLVAARIYERHPDDGDTPAGEILGDPCDPALVWHGYDREPLTLPNDGREWTVDGYYRWLCADADHAQVWRREEPIANPRRPVDLTKLPPIGPPPGRKA
jgi:hypothetical protein